MVTCFHNAAAGQLSGTMPLFGPTLPNHVPTIFWPQCCFHCNPENNLAMSLPSEKEETEFLWHSWAKATLQVFTRGRVPLFFCYKLECIGASVPWGGSQPSSV